MKTTRMKVIACLLALVMLAGMWPVGALTVADGDPRLSLTSCDEVEGLVTHDTGDVWMIPVKSIGVNKPAGTEIQAKAVPAENYHFKEWRLGGETGSVYSTENPVKITLNENLTLFAAFERDEYTVSVSAADAKKGSVSIGFNGGAHTGQKPSHSAQVPYTTIVNLKAYPEMGYQFDGWSTSPSPGGSYFSTSSETSLTIRRNETVFAHFVLNPNGPFRLIVESTDPSMGTVSVSLNGSAVSNNTGAGYNGPVEKGSTVSVSADAKTDYIFQGWSTSPNGSTTPSIGAFRMNEHVGNFSLYAQFEAAPNVINYEVKAIAGENGGVQAKKGNKPGATSGGYTGNMSVNASSGEWVTLYAEADANHKFAGWYDNSAMTGTAVSTDAEYAFQATGDKTLYASFYKEGFAISVLTEDENKGLVAYSGVSTAPSDSMYRDYYNGGAVWGVRVYFWAKAKDGYRFKEWRSGSATGTAVSTSNPYSMIMPIEPVVLYAIFEEIPSYGVTVHTADETKGLINASFADTQSGLPQLADVTNWSPSVTSTMKPAGTYFGAYAKADMGCRFKEWRSGSATGEVVSTSNPYIFSLSKPEELFAIFEEIPSYGVTVHTADETKGLISAIFAETQSMLPQPADVPIWRPSVISTMRPAGTYFGAYAKANPGYRFKEWRSGSATGAVVSTSNPYIFQLSKSESLVAIFEAESHTVRYLDSDGTVLFTETVKHGENAPDKKPADRDGYWFYGWCTDQTYVWEKLFSFDITPIEADTDLYGWFVKYWNVTMDMNGGAMGGGTKFSMPFEEGEKNGIPDAVTMNDWIEMGFITAPDGAKYVGVEITDANGTKTYHPGATYTVISDAKIKVLWQNSLSLNLGGGTLDGKTGTVTIDALYGTKFKLPAPTREGYEFDYWEGSRYNAGDEYEVKDNHVFTAKWKKVNPTNPNVPRTSDNSNLMLWLLLLLGSLLCTLSLLTVEYKRRRER